VKLKQNKEREREREREERKRSTKVWCMIRSITLFNLMVTLHGSPVRDLLDVSP
jgi:hypothetical protein